jgi:hypothetical protein
MPQKDPDPMTHNQALALRECASVSLKTVGINPKNTMIIRILLKNAISDL